MEVLDPLSNLAKNAVKLGAGFLSLKAKLIILLVVVVGFFLFVLGVGIFQSFIGGSDSNSGTSGEIISLPPGTFPLNDTVEGYRSDVEMYAREFGIESHVDVLLAMMMQESGGGGDDPFQASESKCGYIGCITDPKASIEQGVKHYKSVLEKANGDIKLALQSYNFGGGFIDYVNDRGGAYTEDLAVSFSQMMYEKLKHTGLYSCIRGDSVPSGACYGDVMYVDAVLKYYHPVSSDAIAGISPSFNGDFVRPIQGSAEITSDYGYRTHPVTGEEKSMHNGIDFACMGGVTPIHSVGDGVVVYSQGAGTYGNSVVIQHEDQLYTHYAHLSSIDVSEGSRIQAGDKLGVCGTTGRSTGPHLHLETKKEMWSGHMDPKEVLGF